MTSDTMKVQWDQPIEAVHEDGRTMTVEASAARCPDDQGRFCVKGEPIDCSVMFDAYGKPHRTSIFGSWTIRNKPDAAVAPAPVDEWGPAIPNDGFPAWLFLGEHVQYQTSAVGQWFDLQWGWGWESVGPFYRLPANHPHYRTEKPATGPNGVLTGTERLERLEALAARLAAIEVRSFHGDDLVGLVHEARGLTPVDPVEALADKLYAEWSNNSESVRTAILAGIKAGRELGK